MKMALSSRLPSLLTLLLALLSLLTPILAAFTRQIDPNGGYWHEKITPSTVQTIQDATLHSEVIEKRLRSHGGQCPH